MIQTITTKIPNRHGLNIAVLVEIPENPKGLMFIVHGFKGFKEADHIAVPADVALEHNLIAIRFDCTHSLGQSDGHVENSNITTFIEDLTDVIAWAKTQPWYQEPFILAGHSLGGIALLEYTNINPAQVKALAPLATVISGELSIEAAQADNAVEFAEWKAKGWKEEDSRSRPGVTCRIPFSHMENRLLYNVLDYAPSITMPVFMFVGTEDSSCPPSHQMKLFEAIGTSDKEIHIFGGMRHTYRTKKELSALRTNFSNWLAKIL